MEPNLEGCRTNRRFSRILVSICSLFLLGAVVISFFQGCGEKEDPIQVVDGSLDDREGSIISYEEHIAPLMEQSCTSCHGAGAQGPDRNGAPVDVNLDSYEGVLEWAVPSETRIENGTMPPSGFLSPEDKALFPLWIEQGMEE